MKPRGLLVALGLLVLVSGLVYWSNQHEKAKEDEPDPDAPPKIIDVEADSIAKVEIHPAGQDAVVVEKADDGTWRITAPEELAADQDTVKTLVSSMASLDSVRLIEENVTDLAAFGLNEPQLTVVADRSGAEPLTLLVGDETPTGSNFFASVEGDARVFTLASWNKTSLQKSAWDLRDKRLLTFDSDTLSRVELTAQGQTIEIGKNATGDWQILEPQPYRADGGSVEQLISRLREAKMDEQLSAEEEKKASATFAGASRVATVEVTDASGTQTIEVRKAALGDYYAKSSIVDGVSEISDSVGDGLDKGLDDLRNKKLFDFGWNDPNRVEFRDHDQTAVYEKTDDKWMKDGTRMDSLTVRALIDELRGLTAQAFPKDGFGEPVFEITVVSGDGQRVEKVEIAESGDNYIAKRQNEPALYELKSLDVDRLQAAAEDIKEHTDGEDAEE